MRMACPGRRWMLTISLAVLSQTLVVAQPTIQSYDKVATVHENSAVNVQLSNIFCNSTAPADVSIQLVTPVSPCTNCFEMLDCAPNECLQYRAGIGTLSYNSAKDYLVRIVCDDGSSTSAVEVIQVIVRPNTPPYWDPDDLYVNNEINAARSPINTVVFDAGARAKDDESDTLSYSLQVVPSSASFGFEIDQVTGEIKSTVDLRSVCVPHVTLLVKASDGEEESRTLVINSYMRNANVAPVAMNLNREVEIPEDATGNVYSLEFVDTGGLTYDYVTTNQPGLDQFRFIGDPPNLDVVATLDYETASLRQTYLTVQATDGFCTSPLYWLRLKVTDVNEPPEVSPIRFTVSVCEGQVEHDPGITIIDPDITDSHTWDLTMNNNLGYYNIDRATGDLRTTFDYDVDAGGYPTSYVHLIRVTDKGGLQATATVTVSYLDCNDNAPFFDGTQFRHRRTFTATECDVGGTMLGRVIATDIDSDREGNNVITYSGSVGCCRADTAGRIVVESALPAGNVVTFDVYATDSGQTPGPLTSVEPCRVTIVFTVCPPPVTTAAPAPAVTTTTTTTTTSQSGSSESPDNLPWIIVAALLALAFLALLTYMLWRYWPMCVKRCTCRCKRRKVRPRPQKPQKYKPTPTPPREKPEDPEHPGFLMGFWKVRYPNDDAKAVPNLNAKPEPGDIETRNANTIDPVGGPPTTEPPPPPKKGLLSKLKCCHIL